jgi:hypothetical protein
MNRPLEYYVFTRPNAMVGHKFTDDFALCKARSRGDAKRIFSKYYADVEDSEIRKISGLLSGKQGNNFTVLSDY